MAQVLVIDDDLLVSRLLQEHLSNEGFDVQAVGYAEEGLERAIHEKPDLIMLDVNLPDATGFQMCGWLRENPVTKAIPIIMMTGQARFPNQQQIGRSMGADDYILKPFDVIKVGEKVLQLLKDKNGGVAPAKRPAVMESGDIETPVAPTPAPEPVASVPESEAAPVHVEAPPAVDVEEPVHAQSDIFADEKSPEPPAFQIPNEHLMSAAPSPASDSVFIPPDTTVEPEQLELVKNHKPAPRVIPVQEAAEPAHFLEPHDVTPAPVLPPVVEEKPAAVPALSEEPAKPVSFWKPAWSVFGLHVVIAGIATFFVRPPHPNPFQAASYVAGGWALMLGLLVGAAAVLNLSLTPRKAFETMGLAAIPLLIRLLLGLIGAPVEVTQLTPAVLWLRPFDVFELVALVILGIRLGRLPGSSLRNASIATLAVALAWVLTAHGYFRPF